MKFIKFSIVRIIIIYSCFLPLFTCGMIPEQLADFNLDSKRESEKIGLSFCDAVEMPGALNKGVLLLDEGFIKIPSYPTFRARDMSPELNLDMDRGTLEFRFSPVTGWEKGEHEKVLFAYNSIGEKNPGMRLYYMSDKLVFQFKDTKGAVLRAESDKIIFKPGVFYHIAISWKIGGFESDSISKIYLNSKMIAEGKGRVAGLGTAPVDFFIGSDEGKFAANGIYDEIKIWNVEREQFDMAEDGKEEKLKNMRPLLVENFNNYPDNLCANDTLLGRCLALPAECEIDRQLRVDEGMIEFWIKPLKIESDSIEICALGIGAHLKIDNGTLRLNWQGHKLRTDATLKTNQWNSVSLTWSLTHKNASLYLNGKKNGELQIEQTIPENSRLVFSFKGGKALLKGIKIWYVSVPEKNAYDKGFRLSGNFEPGYNALLEYDIPALIKGDYIYSDVLDGVKDIHKGTEPFLFAKGKLTDGKIGVLYGRRVSFNKSQDIIFDLKKVCYISEVVVYCLYNNNKYAENIEFLDSIDGKKWNSAGEVEKKDPPDRKVHNSFPLIPYEKKIGSKARFLKIKARAGPGSIVSISEILIFGRPEYNFSRK